MKVLLLGVGMQGKAALHDLASSPSVSSIIAADRDLAILERYVASRGYRNVTCAQIDASNGASIDRLMALGPDVAIDLLPVPFIGTVAHSAVCHGVNLVNTFYVTPEVAALADEAAAKGVIILPEFGMDPGIDLVMLGEAIKRFDTVTEVYSYGAGFPEGAAANNSLKYKIAWTFEGVLRSYLRPARMMHDGKTVDIPETEQFAPGGVRSVDVEGVGTLEAFPNGDALQYIPYLPDASTLKEMGRYTCRWPGHSQFWKKLVDLHFLDEEPINVDGAQVSPRQFLAALLAPQLQYRDDERDVAFLRVDVRGTKSGRDKRAVLEVVDRRDLQTGFTAMSRTVGFTASIGAQMIADGTIRGTGLLSPVRDVPWDAFRRALDARSITVSER
jgi:lysine 6-dehydrogenase